MPKKKTTITIAHLQKYLDLTKKAIAIVKKSPMDTSRIHEAKDFLDMAERYYADAQHFYKQGNLVDAFAAVNYAHAFLDAGARAALFHVKDNTLFMVDE